MENTTGSCWIVQIRDIRPGQSVVPSPNSHTLFHTIHGLAISTILLSLLSSLLVLGTLIINRQPSKKSTFSTRFPIYIATADVLWSLSHLLDHLYLTLSHRCPNSRGLILAFALTLTFGLGYQQCMQCCLALYMYLKVAKNFSIELGRYEWKLHFVCCCLPCMVTVFALSTDSVGCSFFWILSRDTTINGILLKALGGIIGTVLVTCSMISFNALKNTVKNRSTKAITSYHQPSRQKLNRGKSLTTFIWIAVLVYAPMNLFYWIVILESAFWGKFDAVSMALLIISINFSGFANALGYFQNRRRRAHKLAAISKPESSSMGSNLAGATTTTQVETQWSLMSKSLPKHFGKLSSAKLTSNNKLKLPVIENSGKGQ